MGIYFEKRQMVDGIPYPFHCHEQVQEGPGLMAGAHYHSCIELIYCTEGACEIQLGDSSSRFGVGDLALIHSYEAHCVTAVHPVRTHYLVLKFEPEALCSAERSIFELRYLLPFMLRGTAHQKVISAQELRHTDIPALLRNTLHEYEAREYGAELAIRANVLRAFLWILRRSSDRQAVAWGDGMDDNALRLLHRALQYVEENYSQPLTMRDVARELNMSYSAFSRFFLKYAQRHFAVHLNAVRLQKAEILLTTTDKNVTEIAMATGFSTASYFIQRFREAHGVTPKKYRAQFAL